MKNEDGWVAFCEFRVTHKSTHFLYNSILFFFFTQLVYKSTIESHLKLFEIKSTILFGVSNRDPRIPIRTKDGRFYTVSYTSYDAAMYNLDL